MTAQATLSNSAALPQHIPKQRINFVELLCLAAVLGFAAHAPFLMIHHQLARFGQFKEQVVAADAQVLALAQQPQKWSASQVSMTQLVAQKFLKISRLDPTITEPVAAWRGASALMVGPFNSAEYTPIPKTLAFYLCPLSGQDSPAPGSQTGCYALMR